MNPITFSVLGEPKAQPRPKAFARYNMASITNVAASNQTFYIYATTNLSLPMANWPVFTNLPAVITNAVATNYPLVSFKVSFSLQPGVWFFVSTISNFWGVSPFSNSVGTPPGADNTLNNRLSRP